MEGKMIIISAPSGAGKTTIVKHLLSIKEFKLEFSVSACSRPKREGETECKDYFFMSIDEFKSLIDEDYFVEWEEVYKNHYYGTPKSEIRRIWESGNNIAFDVDVAGGFSLKRTFQEKALSIFIKPPSIEVLEERLRKRNLDNEDDISRRVKKARLELTYTKRFDKVVINDDLDAALKETEELVREFLQK